MLILIWIAYNIFTIIDTLVSYAQVHAAPWYNAFNDIHSAFLFILIFLSLASLIWQYIELKKFSPRFFIALWALFVARTLLYIFVYLESSWFLEYLKFLVPYGLTIAYFYHRKHLFAGKD